MDESAGGRQPGPTYALRAARHDEARHRAAAKHKKVAASRIVLPPQPCTNQEQTKTAIDTARRSQYPRVRSADQGRTRGAWQVAVEVSERTRGSASARRERHAIGITSARFCYSDIFPEHHRHIPTSVRSTCMAVRVGRTSRRLSCQGADGIENRIRQVVVDTAGAPVVPRRLHGSVVGGLPLRCA